MTLPPRSEWPWALLAAERLLVATRHVLALAALPSGLLLWLSAALASAATFQASEDGSRSKHLVLALPRLAALAAAVPAAVVGPACAAELLASDLGWPVGTAAALAALLTLHGLWFAHYHPQLPETWKLIPSRLGEAVPGALEDLWFLTCLCFVLLTVVRLPALLHDVCMLPEDSPRGSSRSLICHHAGMVVGDVLCLPAYALLALCFWRLPAVYGELREASSRLDAVAVVWGHTLAGLCDIIFVCLAVTLLLNPWRLYAARFSTGDWRQRVFDQFQQLVVDLLYLPVVVALLVVPWRLVLAVKRMLSGEGDGRRPLLEQLARGLQDVLLLPFLAALMLFPWRLAAVWRDFDEVSFDDEDGCSDLGPSCLILAIVVKHVFLGLLDLLTLVVILCLVVVPWRLVAAMYSFFTEDDKKYWRCLLLCHLLEGVVVDLPLVGLSPLLLVAPWRFVWLVSDAIAAESFREARWAMCHHSWLALADLLSVGAFALLLAIAPHRLCKKSNWRRLRSGLQSHHLGMSAIDARNLRAAFPKPRVPEEGSVIRAFHGTNKAAAVSIQQEGFRVSTGGMLGPGVYCSRDLSKAESYGDGTVLRLSVRVGKVAVIDRQRHQDQQDWMLKGFDVAWVPAGCGMVQSSREEGCVKDVAAIEVLGEFERARHPRALCVWEVVEGLADLCTLACLVVVVLTVSRLPTVCKHCQKEGVTPWGARCFCLEQACGGLLDVVALPLALALALLSPWRFVACLCKSGARNEAGDDWRCRAVQQLALGLLDFPCMAALLLTAVSGIRLPTLEAITWRLEAKLAAQTSTLTGRLQGYLQGGIGAQFAVLWLLVLLLSDLLVALGALLVALLIVRLPSLCRSAAAMLEAKRLLAEGADAGADVEGQGARTPRDGQMVGPSMQDTLQGLERMAGFDGHGSAAGGASATFFRSLVLKELLLSLVYLPALLLAPVLVLLPLARLLQRFARCRLAADARCRLAMEARQRSAAEPARGQGSGAEAPSTAGDAASPSPASAAAKEQPGACEQLPDSPRAVAELAVGTLLEVLPGRSLQIGGKDYYREGDRGRISRASFEDSSGVLRVDVTWERTGLKSWSTVDSLAEVFKVVSQAPELSTGMLLQVLPGRSLQIDGREYYREGDKGWISRAPFLDALDGGVERVDVAWERTGLTSFCAVDSWAEVFKPLSQATLEQQPPKRESMAALPLTNFLAHAIAATLDLAESAEGEGLVPLQLQVAAGILLLFLLSVHELASLLAMLLGVGGLLPQTLGLLLWPASWHRSTCGQGALDMAHVIQLLILPATVATVVLLILLPVLFNWHFLALVPALLDHWKPREALESASALLSKQALWHPAVFVLVQFAWALAVSAALEVLARALFAGGYRPLRGLWLTAELVLGLATGRSAVWRLAVDPCFGTCVRFAHLHRRTCGCVGELLLCVLLLCFACWPLLLAAVVAPSQQVSSVGELAARWASAGLASLFMLFHAVRIGKASWRADTSTRGMGSTGDVEAAPAPAPQPSTLGAASSPADAPKGKAERKAPARHHSQQGVRSSQPAYSSSPRSPQAAASEVAELEVQADTRPDMDWRVVLGWLQWCATRV